jgi:predicted O-linked N-acetylglucosamine transferase (SPINDLY family)
MLKKILSLLIKEKPADLTVTDTANTTLPLADSHIQVKLTADELKSAGDQAIKINKLEQALQFYQQSLEINPNQPNVYNNQGIALYYLKQLDAALSSYDQALALNPDYAQAYNNRGLTLHDLKQFDEALVNFNQAIALKSDYAEAYNNLGLTLSNLKRLDEALINYERAITLNPDYAEAYVNHGTALYELKRFEEALISYQNAITLKPDNEKAYFNQGVALANLTQLEDALISYDCAIALKADYAEAYINRGWVLIDLRKFDEALSSFDEAITLKPDSSQAFYNRGLVLWKLRRLDEALTNYDHAIALEPDDAGLFQSRGDLFYELKRFDEALKSYERAFILNPNHPYVDGSYQFFKLMFCDWRDVDNQALQLADKINQDICASLPFQMLTLSSNRAIQKKSTELYRQSISPTYNTSHTITKQHKRDKICIGYFSADFRNHAVSTLTAELFELHDRSQFEIIAFSFGPTIKDEMRLRLEAAFDQFIGVRDRSDQEIVTLARNMGVDIAIDLGGYTQECRPSIFALRAAPLQVNYLGYPGTMGAEFMDYIIADPTIIPPEHQPDYTEKVIYLPSFQVNDSKRQIADKQFTRKELGLPPGGFVFCCFNNNYKINPQNFDSWMRILQQVEGSVLWLFAGSETFITNLTKEAKLRGVDPKRLVFAKRLSAPEYLARYRVADLFLDTLPYNAGTTASDALWAGLPVLTLIGETFAGRMAASLLNAVHLPELITTSQAEYEAMAVRLATHPDELMNVKQKLADNRLTTPLFDTPQFTRNIEAAYTQIYERYHADLAPDHIYVQ